MHLWTWLSLLSPRLSFVSKSIQVNQNYFKGKPFTYQNSGDPEIS